MSRFLILILALSFSLSLWGKTLGGIDLEKGIPANDLVFNGQTLLPDEALELYERSNGKFDLSQLNPEESDLWQNKQQEPLDTIEIDPFSSFEFVGLDLSGNELFIFTARQINAQGIAKVYKIIISRTSHNILMRKALLEKIGYRVPSIKHVPGMVLQLEDQKTKERFISTLQNATMASSARWVTQQTENQLTLQDVLILDSQEEIYNLAMGFIFSDTINGRRSLNALLVPYSLTSLDESINSISWLAGRIEDKQVLLPYTMAEEFAPSIDDARWIMRRIANLGRDDWQDIVEAGQLPGPVQTLLLEKLLARRNNAVEMLGIEAPLFEINTKVSFPPHLVDGILNKEFFEGYGRRFAYGAAENPLTSKDMLAYLQSKGMSSLLDTAMNYLNDQDFLRTNIEDKSKAAIEEIVAKSLIDAAKEGTAESLKLATFSFPFIEGKFILNRQLDVKADIIDQGLLYLKDSIGVSVGGGLFIGGISDALPVNAKFKAQAHISRTYAHSRPVLSLKKANKYPFKNLLVPLLKSQYAKKLDKLLNADREQLSAEEQETLIKEVLDLFNANMETKESFVITNSLVFDSQVVAQATFKLLGIELGADVNELMISRLHIYKAAEKEIHIYKSFGEASAFTIGVGAQVVLPIVKFQNKNKRGTAQTKFHSLNLDPYNPQIIDRLFALKAVLQKGSLERLEAMKKPLVIKHKFKEAENRLNLIVFDWKHQRSTTNMEITAPDGEIMNFFRFYDGDVVGLDYQSYADDLLNFLIGKIINTDVSVVLSTASANPGFTFMGKAQNKIVTYEGITEDKKTVHSPFIKLTRIWNGWKTKSKNIEKLVKKIEKRLRFDLFSENFMAGVKKVFLYNLNLNYFFHQEGIEHMRGLSEKSIKNIFRKYTDKDYLDTDEQEETDDELNEDETEEKVRFFSGEKRFLRFLKKAEKYEAKGNLKKHAKYLIKAIKIAERKLSVAGLIKLVGGEENLFIISDLDGFREGDENGDQTQRGPYEVSPTNSNTLGEIGDHRLSGPFGYLMQKTNIKNSELFVNWIMGRII